MSKRLFAKTVMVSALVLLFNSAPFAQSIGIFENHGDVGQVQHAGTSAYDSVAQRYNLSGSGANIWFKSDQFHYLRRKMKGDFILQARGMFEGKGVDPHRKWGWMVRNSLDTSSAMASVQ